MRGKGVHHCYIGDGDAPWEDHADVPLSLNAGSRAICGIARPGFEAGETAEWWLEGGVNTVPVHSTAQ